MAPSAARTCGRSAARATAAPAVQRPAARLLDPRAVRGVRAALARYRTCAASAPPGVPVVGIGHNGHVAWGFTSRPLRRGRPLRRAADRRRRATASRARSGGWTAATSASLPRRRLDLPTCSTAPRPTPARARRPSASAARVHGPVQARAGGVAYARRYAIWGREIETLTGLAALNDATNVSDVDAAMRQGHLERERDRRRRPRQHRLLAPGPASRCGPSAGTSACPTRAPARPSGAASSAPTQRPQVINPRRASCSNWNNVPSVGWTNGDGRRRASA